MEEIIQQLKEFLGDKAKEINIKGSAEINIILKAGIHTENVSAQLKEHIVEIINNNSVAKINLLDSENTVIDQFSLIQ